MIHSNSSHVFKKTVIATTVAMLCLSSNYTFAAKAGENIPRSPFAYVPLHLQQTTVTTTGNKPKPNVMLFIDDSGSMNSGSGVPRKSRMDLTKEVFIDVIAEFGDDFNWGLHSLRQFSGDVPFMNAAQITNYIRSMSGSNVTPAVKEYVDALTQTMNALDYRCQKSYVVMMSDGDAYNGNYNFTQETFGQPTLPEYHGYKPYFDRYEFNADGTLRFEFEWGQNRYSGRRFVQTYIPRRSSLMQQEYRDASASLGGGMSFYSTIAAKYDFKTNADGVDDEGIGWDADPDYPLQSVKTYTIGFGSGISQYGTQFLQNGAQPDASNHYMATSRQELLDGLRGALSEAQSEIDNNAGVDTVSVSTPASTGSDIPELSAYLTLDTVNWNSMLVFNKYDVDGITVLNEKRYPSFADQRLVMIHDGTNTSYLDGTNRPSKEFFGITNEDELKFGLIPWLSRDLSQSDEVIENKVASVVPATDRVVQKYRSRAATATDRARMMGDVMGSPILAMVRDETTNRDGYLVTAANDGMVYIFKNTYNDANHPFKLIANFIPGAIPREDWTTQDVGGNVVPANDTIAKALKATAEEGYGRTSEIPHLFLNNGGIVYRTTPETPIPATTTTPASTAAKQTFIVGATGQGGRGAYALNIGGFNRITNDPIAFDAYRGTNNNTLLNEVPLWVTKEEADNKLGYTIGTPQIGQIATEWTQDKPNIYEKVRLYAFLGNGYPINPSNNINPSPTLEDKPTLYVYEALGQEMGTKGPEVNGDSAGTLVTRVPVPDSVDLHSSSLATPTLVDRDFDGVVDTAYAGDYDGNLYRFDLTGSPADWESQVKLIYKGLKKSTGSNSYTYSQPITAAPATYRISKDKYIIIFGTGSDLYQTDLDNIDRQSLIGIYDDLSETSPSAITRSDLQTQSIYEVSNDKRYVTNNALESNHKGWVLDLTPGTGERIVVKPELVTSSAFFTTRNYTASTTTEGSTAPSTYSCSTITQVTRTEGESWLMGVNVLTGGSFDLTKDAFFESELREVNGNYESAAGLRLDGISSGVNVHSRSRYNIYATTPNGDAGGNGLGDILTSSTDSDGDVVNNNGNEQRNDCLPVDDYQAQVLDEGSTPLKSFSISAKLCSEIGMYRLNQRDVPL